MVRENKKIVNLGQGKVRELYQVNVILVICFGNGGWRLLLYLTFYIDLVRECLFLSGKSQGILKTELMSVSTMLLYMYQPSHLS